MSTLKLSLLLFLAFVVSACSQLAPFEDRRREPGTEYIYVGSSKLDKPAICYNPLWEDKEDIQKIADEICQSNNTGTKAELVKKDAFSCKLFVPTKAYFKCVK